MSEYMLLFRGVDPEDANLSPEEIQAYLQRWHSWIESMQEREVYKGGAPLGREGRVVHPDNVVTDGPFAESKEVLGGYIIIDVKTLDEAVGYAKECPIAELKGRVEVRPVAALCPTEEKLEKAQSEA